MMTTGVRVITNSLGSCDWTVVAWDGESVWEGHSISPRDLHKILEACNGFDYIVYHELTDAQMENWQESIYE